LRENIDAACRRVTEQQVVEGRPRDLPGLRRTNPRGSAEVRVALGPTIAGHERRAPFLGKTGLPDEIVGADRRDHVVDRREQRLADVESREPIAFEKNDAMSRSREPGGRRRTGRTAADDDHLTVE
jgi:hypothetical protein